MIFSVLLKVLFADLYTQSDGLDFAKDAAFELLALFCALGSTESTFALLLTFPYREIKHLSICFPSFLHSFILVIIFFNIFIYLPVNRADRY